MAVYFITGKLGSGKTLSAVGRIREYLQQGRPVATNLDLNLVPLCGPKAKTPKVYRLPDKPALDDLEAIGNGNTSYDESRNGLVVLDECGTWFNSRTWGDKERQAIINWFLHARKKGWDIIFIVQSIQVVDKQARLTLAEHVVYCRRLDKLTIPLIGSIWKFFWGTPLRFPKLHMAIVKYGDQPGSLTVDRWWYLGLDLYSAYDTKQAFSDYYPHTTYQLLTPWLSRGRYMLPMTWSRAMRLTKIYLKRFSRPVIGGAMFAAGVAAAVYFREPVQVIQEAQAATQEAQPGKSAESVRASDFVASVTPVAPAEPVRPVHDQYSSWVISGYIALGNRSAYTLRSPDGRVLALDTVAKLGVDVFPRDNCHVRLVSTEDATDFADVFAPNCIPASAEPAVQDGIEQLAAQPTVPDVPAVYVSAMPARRDVPLVDILARFE